MSEGVPQNENKNASQARDECGDPEESLEAKRGNRVKGSQEKIDEKEKARLETNKTTC
jgi:hypothetical protein